MKNLAAHTPDWMARSAILQINPRTFCEEGTLPAIVKELPQIAALGFGIVYLCPIFETDDSADQTFWSRRQLASGTGNPKNPYRMNNYFEIDSEYGTRSDLRDFVEECHRLGMKVLLDLVYLHMGPNAGIFKRHPDFVKQDADGNILQNYWNFPELDYDHEGVREFMWSNMVYYVGEFGIDGFRCDVGDNVPLDFWREGLRRIRTINPDAALINEGSNHQALKVFSSMYSFYWHECLHEILIGNAAANELRLKWEENHQKQLKGSKILRDMDNHDTVTDWPERTEITAGHNGMEMILTLNYFIDGIPMVYAGNELADTTRQSMFSNRFHRGDYSPTDRGISKEEYSLRRQNVIKSLNKIKRESAILDNGKTQWLDNSADNTVISFARVLDGKKLIFIGNFSKKPVVVSVDGVVCSMEKVLLSSEEKAEILDNKFSFPAFGYVVMTDENGK